MTGCWRSSGGGGNITRCSNFREDLEVLVGRMEAKMEVLRLK